MYKIDQKKLKHSPRPLRFWECCLAVFNERISSLSTPIPAKTAQSQMGRHYKKKGDFFLNQAFDYFITANTHHLPHYTIRDKNTLKKKFFTDCQFKALDTSETGVYVQELRVPSSNQISKPLIAVANTRVEEDNILRSIRGRANTGKARTDKLKQIFENTKKERADILLFPECFIPINLLDRVTKFAVAEQTMVVTGLEHITVGGISYNFVVTILPLIVDGIKDALISYRLKNHYAHGESLLIKANHFHLPSTRPHIYDLFIWKGIYFSTYYCFELADIFHRSLFKGKIDLLIASEWNADVNYFSNIVESIARDVHAYVAQINTSQYGDTRITRPSRTEIKDILKLKGGKNDTILTGEIDLNALREFQRELYLKTKDNKNFKPLPPDFDPKDVLKRINGKPMFD